MVMTFYPHLPNNYEDWEDNCEPTHQSMRIVNKNTKRPYRGTDHWYHFDSKSVRLINKILEASIGMKFNEVYSKICKRFCKRKDMFLRRMFRDEVDSKYLHCARHSFYYVDDEGIIREYSPNQPNAKKTVKIPVSESEIYYKINYSNFLKYPKILDRMRITFGNKLYYKIFNDGKVSQSLGDRIGNTVCLSLRYDYNLQYFNVDNFIIRTKDVKYIEYVRGSKEFTKYYSEYFQARRKSYRESKKKREQELSDLLHRIEYKRKLEALQLNEVTRDRLGFCKDSFTGEFYHGQKRKKRKSQNE